MHINSIITILFLLDVILASTCDLENLLTPGVTFGHFSSDLASGTNIYETPSVLARSLVYSCLRSDETCFASALDAPSLTATDLAVRFWLPHRADPRRSLLAACRGFPGAEQRILYRAETLGGLSKLPEWFFDDPSVLWGTRALPGCLETPAACEVVEYAPATAGALAKKAAWGCQQGEQGVFDAALKAGADVNAQNAFIASNDRSHHGFNQSLLHICAASPLATYAVPALLAAGARADATLAGNDQDTLLVNDVPYHAGSTPLHMLNYSSPSAPRLVCALLWVLAGQDTAATAGTDICDQVITLYNIDTDAAATMARHVLTSNSAGMLPLHYAAALHAPAADPAARALRTLLSAASHGGGDVRQAVVATVPSMILIGRASVTNGALVHMLSLAYARGPAPAALCSVVYVGAGGAQSLDDASDICNILDITITFDPEFAAAVSAVVVAPTYTDPPLFGASLVHDARLDPSASYLRLLLRLGPANQLTKSVPKSGYQFDNSTYNNFQPLTALMAATLNAPPLSALCLYTLDIHDHSKAAEMEYNNVEKYCAAAKEHISEQELMTSSTATLVAKFLGALIQHNNASRDPSGSVVIMLLKLLGNYRKSAVNQTTFNFARAGPYHRNATARLFFYAGSDSTDLHLANVVAGPPHAMHCVLAAAAGNVVIDDLVRDLDLAADDAADMVCRRVLEYEMDENVWPSVQTYLTRRSQSFSGLGNVVRGHNALLDPNARAIHVYLALTRDYVKMINEDYHQIDSTYKVTYTTKLAHQLATSSYFYGPTKAVCLMALAAAGQLPPMDAQINFCAATRALMKDDTHRTAINEFFRSRDSRGWTPLHYAVSYHDDVLDPEGSSLRLFIELAGEDSVWDRTTAGSSMLNFLSYAYGPAPLSICLLSGVAAGLSLHDLVPYRSADTLCKFVASAAASDTTVSKNLVKYITNGDRSYGVDTAVYRIAKYSVPQYDPYALSLRTVLGLGGQGIRRNQIIYALAYLNTTQLDAMTSICVLLWHGAGRNVADLPVGANVCTVVEAEVEADSDLRERVASLVADAGSSRTIMHQLAINYDATQDPTAATLGVVLRMGPHSREGYSTLPLATDVNNYLPVSQFPNTYAASVQGIDTLMNAASPNLRPGIANSASVGGYTPLYKYLSAAEGRYGLASAHYLISVYGADPIGYDKKFNPPNESSRAYIQALVDCVNENRYFSYHHNTATCTTTCAARPGWVCTGGVGEVAGLYRQQPCTGRTYQNVAGKDACKTCHELGYGVIRVDNWGVDCRRCESNQFVLDGICTSCPGSLKASDDRTTCSVKPGYYFDASSITFDTRPCPAHRYCRGTHLPILCPAGSTTNTSSAASTCIPTPGHYYLPEISTWNYVNSDIQPCPAGYTCAGGSARPARCDAGYYAASAIKCEMCEHGKTPNDTGDACEPCAPGTYAGVVHDGLCSTCPAGHACPGGDVLDPQACTDSHYALAGAATCIDCQAESQYLHLHPSTECSYCPAGTYLDGQDCVECSGLQAPYYCELVEITGSDRFGVRQVRAKQACTSDDYYAYTPTTCALCPRDYLCRNGVRKFHIVASLDVSLLSGRVWVGVIGGGLALVLLAVGAFYYYKLCFIPRKLRSDTSLLGENVEEDEKDSQKS